MSGKNIMQDLLDQPKEFVQSVHPARSAAKQADNRSQGRTQLHRTLHQARPTRVSQDQPGDWHRFRRHGVNRLYRETGYVPLKSLHSLKYDCLLFPHEREADASVAVVHIPVNNILVGAA